MTCVADARLLRLALENLLENAAKYSPEGGTVTVRQTKGTVSVRDQGIGFDQKYEAKIWLPFERLVHDDHFPGTGIGLANVKRIIARHGGKVWASSEPGKGSTFSFTLGSIG